MSASENYEYAIDSVDNAARTLLMLTDRPSIRVVDVATELGVSRSTAHRMVSTLTLSGLLRRNHPDRSYSAGYALSQLALAVLGVADIRAEVMPALTQIARRTGETVHFLVREGTEVVFVAVAEGTFVVRAASRVGVRLPAHITSAGKYLLAELSDEELRRLYPKQQLPPGGTDFAIRQWDGFQNELSEIRRLGYARNHGESESGLSTIGIGIHNVRGRAVGAVALSGPSDRIEPEQERLISVVREVVTQLEATLARGM